MSGFRVVIPARYGSTRLPGKVLRELHGRPMLEHVHRRALESKAQQVIIATDDARIAAAARAFGAEVAMTAATHQSGTDRLNEVVSALGWPDDSVVVNLQGDEPCMAPVLIRQAVQLLEKESQADIATLCFPIKSVEQWRDPNLVKVVLAEDGRALYFSRAALPYVRAAALAGRDELPVSGAYAHLGLYAYRVSALKRFSRLPPHPLEISESLEQLRALANGLRIQVALAAEAPGQGVDTAEDLQRAATQLANM
ncbi:MAG: 3-deoxy-manno-octulosonate cytidylyltransferase [Nevskiales bacterium]